MILHTNSAAPRTASQFSCCNSFVAVSVAALFCVAFSPNCEALTVEEAVAAHAATLAKIKTIYVQLDVSFGQTDAPLERMSTTQSWRKGSQERTLQRVDQSLTPHGLIKVADVDRVSQFSYADSETRTLRGWDPEAPLSLPLDYARNSKQFDQVKGGIGPRDPLGATSDDWATLLLEVARGQSLARFAQTSKLELDESAGPDIVRLKVTATDQANLVDAVIELDPAHGHLIRRLENPKTSTVAVVEGFTPYGEGIWLPDRVRRTVKQAVALAERVDARVNEPIEEADLIVQFPEGARVDEVISKKVHLWGKEDVAQTFESFPLFHEHQIKIVKSMQVKTENVAGGGTNWLLWVNIISIVVLLLLMKFRNRLVEP